MSIAVTAVVAPSRRLRLLLAAFSASLVTAALAVGWLLPERFLTPWAGLPPLLAALALGHDALRAATVRRIDISGPGQLRLTVQQDLGPASPGVPASLMAGAVVWPCCMLLRLRAESGAVWRVAALPDGMVPGDYRALAVALRAVAARTQKIN